MDRPIIFSTEMVRAILEGRKTQTRRVIKTQPPNKKYRLCTLLATTGDCKNVNKFHWAHVENNNIVADQEIYFKCPYGKIGDLLYVREAWGWYTEKQGDYLPKIIYKASSTENFVKWKPSIHMPKKYARLWLEIVGIKVERLQDITVEDIHSEGIGWDDQYGCLPNFVKLWDSINKKRGFGWDVNPWVWVIEFKKL
jgi:hypothetical protein